MSSQRTALLAAAFMASLAWTAPASAQASRSGDAAGVGQAQRKAVDLKQGMTPEEVQKLLGKPTRTTLRNAGSAGSAPWQGTLQWTYAWSRESVLNVVFAAKAPQHWSVDSWDWATY